MDDTQNNSSRRNNILLWGAVFLIVLGIAAYFFFRAQQTNDGVESNTTLFGTLFGGGALPPVGGGDGSGNTPPTPSPEDLRREEQTRGRLFRISEEPVIGATTIPKSNKIKYYKTATGHLFENSFEGNAEQRISNITVPAILKAQWSPSKEYAVLSSYDNNALKYIYTRYKSTTTIESGFLPRNILSITMSGGGENIAYTIPASGSFSLLTARPNNTGARAILTTPIQDFDISWPAKNTISAFTRGSAFAESTLYTINVQTGALTKILGGVEGVSILWSPDGLQLLYSHTRYDGRELALSVLTLATQTVRHIPIRTLPEKCAWSHTEKNVIFCGVPSNLPASGLPDSWWQGSVSFTDTIQRIDTKTGAVTELLGLYAIDALDMFTADDDSFLFFRNKKDGLLWALRLREENN